MPADRAVLVIGEALVDVIVSAEGTVESPGGSPANVALGLGRLGRGVTLVTQLGDDEHGALITRQLGEAGVHVVPSGSRDVRTSTSTARLSVDGSASYVFDLTWDITPPPVGHPALVHTGSLAAVLAPGSDAVQAAVARLRPTTVVSYDPNCRPQLMGDVAAAREAIERWVSTSDVVKVSDEDLRWLYPGADPTASAARWAALGPTLVVLTRGADGASAWLGHQRIDVPAVLVTVVDTVGAGDAFMAGLLDALLDASVPHVDDRRLAGLTVEQVRLALQAAATAAAITVSRRGADLPWRRELR